RSPRASSHVVTPICDALGKLEVGEIEPTSPSASTLRFGERARPRRSVNDVPLNSRDAPPDVSPNAAPTVRPSLPNVTPARPYHRRSIGGVGGFASLTRSGMYIGGGGGGGGAGDDDRLAGAGRIVTPSSSGIPSA